MTSFWVVYWTVLSFVGGLCVGSFLNVCIFRMPADRSIVKPRSFCPGCGTTIAWYDNLPVLSYILLGGRCRHCKGAISLRYPLVELLTGVLFLAIWNRYGADARTPVYMMMTAGLVAGSFIDLDHFILPDRITIGGMVVGPVLSFLIPSLHGQEAGRAALVDSLIGLAVGAGVLLMVARLGTWIFKKDAMGLGDVKLLGAIGAFLGWQAVVMTILVSSLAGSLAGVSLILFGGMKWRSRIPYGPYIAFAAVVWILGGDRLWDWYIRMMSGGW